MKRLLKARATPAMMVGVLVMLAAGGSYALASGSSTISACVKTGTRALYKAPCKAGDQPISWLATIKGVPAGGALTGKYPSPGLAANSVGPGDIAGIPGGRVDSSGSSVPANTDTIPCFPASSSSGVKFLTGGMTSGASAGSGCPSGQVNELKVPRAGAYLVTAGVTMHDTGGVAANRYLYIRDAYIGSDGGTELDSTSGSGGNTTLSTSAVLHLPANDFVYLDIGSTSAETVSGLGNTQFSAVWLGP